jgi:malonyl-CoA decarboxylase
VSIETCEVARPLWSIQESFGIMVNHLYDHDSIEDNHEAFVRDGTIVRSPDVDALLET